MSAKKLVVTRFGGLPRAARAVACLIVVACTSSCSNQVREIPPNEVRQGGTYVVAGLRNERATQLPRPRPAAPSNVIVSDAVTPPGVNRAMMQRNFGFVRADDNGCIGADTIALKFPEPG